MSAPAPRPASTSCCAIEDAHRGDLCDIIRGADKHGGAEMDWTTLLFSFQGRINRGKYWLAVLIYFAVWTTFIALCLIWLGGANLDNLLSIAGTALLLWLIGFILFVVLTWSGLPGGV